MKTIGIDWSYEACFVVPTVTDEQLAATHAGWRPPEVRYLRPKGYGSRGAVPGGHGCWEKRRYSLTEKDWGHGAAR